MRKIPCIYGNQIWSHMDQVGGKLTSQGVVEQQRLIEFDRFLRQKRLVPEDKVNHYCRWADNFLHGIGYRYDKIDQHSLAGFVNRLRKEGRQEWQVVQA